ncbi:MAG: hypothetical protein AABZ53_09850 [Planctomycetota bacterium]
MKKLNVLLVCVALGSFGLNAYAQDAGKPAAPADGQPGQPGGRGGRGVGGGAALTGEKATAAWTAQATGVAKHLNLNEAQTKELVKAYTEARESYNTASTKAREEAMKKMQEERAKNKDDAAPDAGGGRGNRGGGAEMAKAMEELNKAERAKFEKAIPSISGDQRTKIMASLGTLNNRQWDTMTDNLLGLKLEAAKQQTAADAIEEFVITQAKLRPAGGPAAPGEVDQAARDKMRTEMEAARKKLTDTLKTVMTEEQAKKFEGGQGGGRGGAGGPGGPPPADGTAPATPRRRPGGGAGGGGGGGF